MMCSYDAFSDFYVACIHKFVILHMFVEEKALQDLCCMLLYSAVNRSSMSMPI